jgi:hypothetical protein
MNKSHENMFIIAFSIYNLIIRNIDIREYIKKGCEVKRAFVYCNGRHGRMTP